MLTTNGAKIITYNKIIVTNTTSMTKTDGTEIEELTGGSATYAFKRCGYKNTLDTATSGNASMVMNLGVGSAEPTSNDYWLDETEISGVDVNTVVECARAQGTDTWAPSILSNGNIAYTYVFRNNGNAAVTITEIGLSFVCTMGKFLVGRCLIPPRTIQPNETVTFTYELAFA